MKIIYSEELSELANKLTKIVCIDCLLKQGKFSFVSQSLYEKGYVSFEEYISEADELFKFGHKFYRRTIVSFNDGEHIFYVVDKKEDIEKYLKDY